MRYACTASGRRPAIFIGSAADFSYYAVGFWLLPIASSLKVPSLAAEHPSYRSTRRVPVPTARRIHITPVFRCMSTGATLPLEAHFSAAAVVDVDQRRRRR